MPAPDGVFHDMKHGVDGLAAHGGQIDGREVASQYRCPAKQREPRFAEEPQVADDRPAERHRHRSSFGIDDAVAGVELSVGGEGLHQLGHVERAPGRAGDQRPETRSGRGAQHVLHEAHHRVVVQRAERHLQGAVADRRVDEVREFVASRDRPERQHEGDRHVDEVSGGEAQGCHGGGVGPLEVVDRDEQRSFQGHTFEELGKAFDDPELGRPLVDEAGDLGAELIA